MCDLDDRQHDVILLGTGLTQSILSAALCKVGKSVLHYEKLERYGGDAWATLDLAQLSEWLAALGNFSAPQDELEWTHSAASDSTPEVLRRAWQKQRWRASKLHTDDRKEVAGSDPSSPLPEKACLDPSISSNCHRVPLLTPGTTCMRLLRTSPLVQQLHKPDTVANEPSRPQEKVELMAADSTAAAGSEAAGSVSQQASGAWKTLGAQARAFQLDVTPTSVITSSDITGLLLSSGVASYLEFKSLQTLYVASRATVCTLHKVPCSKTDVFSSTLLPAKEKRQLMKFLQFVADWGYQQNGQKVTARNESELGQGRSLQRPQNKTAMDYNATSFLDQPFQVFLEHCKLTSHLQWVVIHALALPDGAMDVSMLTTEQGLVRVFRHLSALGLYGETAFLWPHFGSNELVQAFCRIAAVWGGIFVSREQPKELVLDSVSKRCLGVVNNKGEAIACDWLVAGQDSLPGCRRGSWKVLRRISVTDKAVLDQERQTVGGIIPPGVLNQTSNQYQVYFYSIDSGTRCCPEGLYVLYLSTPQAVSQETSDTGTHVLEEAASLLIDFNGARELWSMTFEHEVLQAPGELVNDKPCNILFVSDDLPAFYLQSPFEQARTLFEKICPGEEFLPAEVPEGVARFASKETQDQESELLSAALEAQHQTEQRGTI